MEKEILYILLDNYAEHEMGFMPRAVNTDAEDLAEANHIVGSH